MTEKVRTIAWDFDGVLNRSTVNGKVVWQEAFESDIGYDIDQFESFVFGPGFSSILQGKEDLAVRIELWKKAVGCGKSTNEILHYWFTKDTKLDDGLLGLIRYFSSRGVEQVIATNTDRYRAIHIRAQLLESGINIPLAASGFIGELKPSKAFFLAVEGTVREGNSFVLIDDSEKNIVAAREHGWEAIQYAPQLEVPQLLEQLSSHLHEKQNKS